MITRRLEIIGQVHGVGFREWLRARAGEAGLAGWVRNRVDGCVEALLSGEEAAVDAVVAACHRGPNLARVEMVRVEPGDPPGEPGFHRRPTCCGGGDRR
jgi:acylphosphatase